MPKKALKDHIFGLDVGVKGLSASGPVRVIFNSPHHPEQSQNYFIPISLICFFNGLTTVKPV
jgi:hypothetical protein